MNFGNNFKQISVIGIGDIVSNSISVLFWFYLAMIIVPHDYGHIHYLMSFSSIAATLSLIGGQNVLTVFIAKKNKALSTLFCISLICSLISFIVILLVFNKFEIGILAIGIVIFTHGLSINLGNKNFSSYTKFSILQKSLMVAFSLLFYYLIDTEWIVFGIALSYFVYIKIFIEYIKKYKIDLKQIKINKKFIFENYYLMLTNLITTQIDKIIITPILGLAVLGNYSLAVQVVSIFTLIPSIVFKYILPNVSSGLIDKKLQRDFVILSIILASLGIIISPIIIPIFFEEYNDVVMLIQIMSLSTIPIGINTFYYSYFLSSENAKIPLFGGIISSIVLISGMFTLTYFFGSVGIAVTNVLTYSSVCLFSYIMFKINRNSKCK